MRPGLLFALMAAGMAPVDPRPRLAVIGGEPTPKPRPLPRRREWTEDELEQMAEERRLKVERREARLEEERLARLTPADRERLAKAEAKRERKRAKRLRDAQRGGR